MGKRYFMQGNQKKRAWIAICIADKIDLKLKMIKRDKEGHFITIKRSIEKIKQL